MAPRVLTIYDLVDGLAAADDPVARKRLKAAMYEAIEACLPPDPDPLTVVPANDGNRNAPLRRQAPDLRDQHPARRASGRRLAGLVRGLDLVGLVPRKPFGGSR